MVIYFDDILTYNKTVNDHLTHLHEVFSILETNTLYINSKKCVFLYSNIKFLGCIIGQERVKPDPQKIKAIKERPTPTPFKEVQSFLGLASFYRKFIKNLNSITAPLTQCLKKGKFAWSKETLDSFNALKEKLANPQVLALPDFTKIFEVAVDASSIGIGAVLSQEPHPLDFLVKSGPLMNKNFMH